MNRIAATVFLYSHKPKDYIMLHKIKVIYNVPKGGINTFCQTFPKGSVGYKTILIYPSATKYTTSDGITQSATEYKIYRRHHPPKKKSRLLTTNKIGDNPNTTKQKILKRRWCPWRMLLSTQLIDLLCPDAQILLNLCVNLYGLLQKKRCIHSLCLCQL